MPYNFVADSIHIRKLCSGLSSSEVQFYTKNSRFAFWSRLWDVHLRLIGKCVVDLIELFDRCYG